MPEMHCWDVSMAWKRPVKTFWPRPGPQPRHNTSAIFRVIAPTIRDAIVIAETDRLPPNCSDPVVWVVAVVWGNVRGIDMSSETESRVLVPSGDLSWS